MTTNADEIKQREYVQEREQKRLSKSWAINNREMEKRERLKRERDELLNTSLCGGPADPKLQKWARERVRRTHWREIY